MTAAWREEFDDDEDRNTRQTTSGEASICHANSTRGIFLSVSTTRVATAGEVPRSRQDSCSNATRARCAVEVSADGAGVVPHVRARLLADLADRTTLTAQLSAVFAARTAPPTEDDPAPVLVDVAVMFADGGECISDIATLINQGEVFGPVASDSTYWR
jgi:hypothetical protein